MSRAYARLLDPQLQAQADSFADYDARLEPLEDRLYLPCGVDPHGDMCGVVFAHPYPQRKEILAQRIIRNNHLEDMLWLIETGDRLARSFQATPIYVFESTKCLLACSAQLPAPCRLCHRYCLWPPDQTRPRHRHPQGQERS